MRTLLILGLVAFVGYGAYKYCKKKSGCKCGCKDCQDQGAGVVVAETTTEETPLIPGIIREVFDADPTSFFRPPAKRMEVGQLHPNSTGLSYGAGMTDNVDAETGIALVKNS